MFSSNGSKHIVHEVSCMHRLLNVIYLAHWHALKREILCAF